MLSRVSKRYAYSMLCYTMPSDANCNTRTPIHIFPFSSLITETHNVTIPETRAKIRSLLFLVETSPTPPLPHHRLPIRLHLKPSIEPPRIHRTGASQPPEPATLTSKSSSTLLAALRPSPSKLSISLSQATGHFTTNGSGPLLISSTDLISNSMT